jgi:hypothetical protein
LSQTPWTHSNSHTAPTNDTLSIALHSPGQNGYLYKNAVIYYSTSFNTIVPSKLITKLRILGLNTSLCNWILDFLSGHTQVVKVGNNTSATQGKAGSLVVRVLGQ